jgi:hypothetical protein
MRLQATSVGVACIEAQNLFGAALEVPMKYRLAIFLAVVLSTVSGAAFAHHGAANYDMKKSVTVKGTVTDFEFKNPHTLIYIEVKDGSGEVQKWQGELTSPNHLARAGWSKNTVKVGEEITLIGAPSKSGAPVLWIQKVLSPAGVEIKTSEEN